MSLLGLDVGTTGIKAVVFDDFGRVLSQEYREYNLEHPKPGWSELNANILWKKAKEIMYKVNIDNNTVNDPVEAIGVSCQGEAIAPIDNKGQILYNFSVSFDNRTLRQKDWWEKNANIEDLFKITGMPLHPMYSINKVMWFADQRPEIHQKAWKYVCIEDFIIYRLCGETAIDFSLAARTMAFDVNSKKWSKNILDKAGLNENLFSKAYKSGTSIGYVKKDIANELAFKKQVVVVTGGHDQPCGALGAGIIKEGMAMDAIGTSEVICPAFSQANLSEAMLRNNYCCYPHTYPDLYVSIAFNLTGGLLLKWYRDTLCTSEIKRSKNKGINPYSLIIENASTKPADIFILPHFVGAGTPVFDPESKGAIVGLTNSTTKSDITRAILDSTNYEMRFNIESMENSGISIKELRAIGGGAKSSKWLQMKADVCGKKITSLKISEAASLGAAILAGIGIGKFSSAKEAVSKMVKVKRVYIPDRNKHEEYSLRYKIYLKIYPTLKKLNQYISRKLV